MNREIFNHLKRQAASGKRITEAQAAWHKYFEHEMLAGTHFTTLTHDELATLSSALNEIYGRYEPP